MSEFFTSTLRVLRLKNVIHKTGLSRSTIYLHLKSGEFPPSICLGSKSIGWLESDIDNWITSRTINTTLNKNTSRN